MRKLTEFEALQLIDAQLKKGPRRGAKNEADAEGDDEPEAEVEEAA